MPSKLFARIILYLITYTLSLNCLSDPLQLTNQSQVKRPSKKGKNEKNLSKKVKKKTKTKKVSVLKKLNNTLMPSGSIRINYYQRDKNFSDQRNLYSDSLWINLKPKTFFSIQSYFDINVHHSNSKTNQGAKFDAKEIFLEKSIGILDLKVGRQIISWGRADKINPTDSLSTKDFTKLVINDDDQKIGSFALHSILNTDNFRFYFIFQPEWREPIFPQSPLPTGITTTTLKPEGNTDQSAIKIDRIGNNLDYSFSYFSGIDRSPDLKIISNTSASLNLGLDFLKIQVYGADCAFNWGDIGVRSEIAYTKTLDSSGDNPLIKNNFWYGVIGGDKSIYENFNVNFQAFYRKIENWKDPSSLTDTTLIALGKIQNLNTNQYIQSHHGYAVRFAYKSPSELYETEISYSKWLNKNDSLVRSRLTMNYKEALKFYLGADSFFGPPDSVFGKYNELSTLYFESRYYF